MTEERRRITTARLGELKTRGEKIAMLTAYDYSLARILDRAGIDVLLVGDMPTVCGRRKGWGLSQ